MLSYLLFIATVGGIYGLLALSLNLIWGGAGMVNLGLAGFFAVGAYASALLTTAGHSPIAVGWLAVAGTSLVAGGGGPRVDVVVGHARIGLGVGRWSAHAAAANRPTPT